MFGTIKTLATGVGILALGTFGAHADGVNPIFYADGGYIDDIEIIGDVVMPTGIEYAVLEMREQHLRFYVDPDAIYVTMIDDNPILTRQLPFNGFWVSTASVDYTGLTVCSDEIRDENGESYPAHGSVIWTNSGIAANGYELAFTIDRGTCDRPVKPWGYSRPALDFTLQSAVPHDDITPQDALTIIDGNGEVWMAERDQAFTTLISQEARKIVVSMATAVASSETFYEQDVIVMQPDCFASSLRRGYGTWSWANGGFIVEFDTLRLAFPRADAPIDNNGGCRM
ncbi:MAG: hypothetical protein ACI9VX_001250 [Dinoroseobacter sp.]|jgi:hypothetical protein